MCVLPGLSTMYCACAELYLYLWPLWLYHILPHYLINSSIFGKKTFLKLKCLFWFSLHLLSKQFVILRRTERDIIKVYVGLHVKCPLVLSYVNETWVFSKFSTNYKEPNFMKIHPMGAELFHAGGQTDMTKLIVTFRNSANASKKK